MATMFSCARRRLFQVCGALTGVYIMLTLLAPQPIPQAPFTGVNEMTPENPISVPQNNNGRSVMMNDTSQKDVQLQKQETQGGNQEKLGNGLEEETVSLGNEMNEMSIVNNSMSKELRSRKTGASNLEKIQDGAGTVNNTSPKWTSGKVNLVDGKLQDLELKSETSDVIIYTNDTINKVVSLFKAKVKQSFANEQLDINFIPGEVIPIKIIRRILIASNWRSGTSYLGKVMSAYPGTFYTYEPLHYLSIRYFQTGNDIPSIIKLLNDISTCNFAPQTDYMKHVVMKENKVVWESCGEFCFHQELLSEVCPYFPVHLIKTVRLGLTPIEMLLENSTLDWRIIHLVRDPRGTFHSKWKQRWCRTKDCNDPQTVCNNLLTDLQWSKVYAKKYPERFLQVRYEDLSLDPELVTKLIFRFLGLHYHRDVQEFVKSNKRPNTNSKSKERVGPGTTFRDPPNKCFAWRDEFTFKRVDDIQRPCKDVLSTLGFNYFRNAEELLNKNISVFAQTPS